MLKYLLDKIRDHSGPLKEVRLVVGDVIEEFADTIGHYIKKIRKEKETSASDDATVQSVQEAPVSPPPETSPPVEPSPPKTKTKTKSKPKTSAKTQKSAKSGKKTAASEKKEPPRTIEVSEALKTALDNAAYRRKQEFKVLTILWDARSRQMGGMSAKALADHGMALGLPIRHENIRKVIKMRLSTYVDVLQERSERATLNHYRLNDSGASYFEETYLK